MLEAFITTHRDAIITEARTRVGLRESARLDDSALENGIPVFLDQLGVALARARSGDASNHEALTRTAGRHGHELLRMGLSIGQVVHAYGDVCQAITSLAMDKAVRIPTDEFKTLNLCLDDAIAGAVTEYALHRDVDVEALGAERLGVLAHELRNHLNTAMLAFEIIQGGGVPAGGSTAILLGRSLNGLRDLIDRSLAEARLDAGLVRLEKFSVADFIHEVEIGASIQARARGRVFAVSSVDPTLMVEGDRQTLAAALSNLLQNALKFTPELGHVSLTVRENGDRVIFDVEDACGGLPPGKIEELFVPFAQRGADRSGVGLGLSICLKAAKMNGGELRARDLPGKGCVFTLDLPKK